MENSDGKSTVVINLQERRPGRRLRFDPSRFIMKVQRPLYSSPNTMTDDPVVLMYSANHDVIYNHALTKEVLGLFGEDEYKIFVWASLTEGQLALNERAPWQEW